MRNTAPCPFKNMHTVYGVAAQKLILNVQQVRLRLIFVRALYSVSLFSKGFSEPPRRAVVPRSSDVLPNGKTRVSR